MYADPEEPVRLLCGVSRTLLRASDRKLRRLLHDSTHRMRVEEGSPLAQQARTPYADRLRAEHHMPSRDHVGSRVLRYRGIHTGLHLPCVHHQPHAGVLHLSLPVRALPGSAALLDRVLHQVLIQWR